MTTDPHFMLPPEAGLDLVRISWTTVAVPEPTQIALQAGLIAAAFVMLTPIAARSAMAISLTSQRPPAKKRAEPFGPA